MVLSKLLLFTLCLLAKLKNLACLSFLKLKMSRLPEKSLDTNRQWYNKGLSFSCTMCGQCCSGSSGSVRFSEIEAGNIAEKLGISIEKVIFKSHILLPCFYIIQYFDSFILNLLEVKSLREKFITS